MSRSNEPSSSGGPAGAVKSHDAPSPTACSSVARDLEQDAASCLDPPAGDPSDSPILKPWRSHASSACSMAGSYRRPSFVAGGPRPTIVPYLQQSSAATLTQRERDHTQEEEVSLLRDNHLLPPKQSRASKGTSGSGMDVLWRILSTTLPPKQDEEQASAVEDVLGPSETTALLADDDSSGTSDTTRTDATRKWQEAVSSGKIKTTWQRETKTLVQYSRPLIATFFLQYSLPVAGIFTVGHMGKVELGAVSLASMTANITGYALYQGLATALDTLCAQAYGSGHKELVGVQLQRMIYFLWSFTVPIAILWLSSDMILQRIIPQSDIAELAGTYLKILVLGAPGFAAFESGKRFVQAQGLFNATLYVLLICAPLNALMNWLFVWKFQWGFIGAPIAVVVTDNLLPLLLFMYVFFIDGRECWPGLTRRALCNWGPMIRLALPGLVMVEAECLAFEILTLAASYLGTTQLAAQSVLSTLLAIAFQIPFPISVASSTRIANLVGATLSDAAQTSIKVALIAACGVGIFNTVILFSLRDYIPYLFTNDSDVVAMVSAVLPLCAAFQLFDALAAICNGILRGIGRQEIGGWVNLSCYYLIAIPISMGTAFGLHWELYGLWTGNALALALVASIEGWFIYRTNWAGVVEDAQKRNTL